MTDKPLHSILPPELSGALEFVSQHPAPAIDVGLGFAPTSHDGPRIREGMPIAWLGLDLQTLPGAPLKRWSVDPRVLVYAGEEAPRVLLGEPNIVTLYGEEALEFDSSKGRFVLQLSTPTGEVVLDIAGGAVAEHRTRREAAPAPSGRTPALGELPQPRFADLDGAAVPDWLLDRARRLAPQRSDGAAEAVGLILRLGLPKSTAARARDVAELRAGRASARVGWASAWLASVQASDLVALGHMVRGQSLEAVRSLDALSDAMGERPDDAAAMAADVLLARDRLESLTQLLELHRSASGLRPLLRALDRRCIEVGAALGAALSGSDALDEDWLGTVSWQEPEAWWGALLDDAP